MCTWRLLLLAALPALVGVGAGEVIEATGSWEEGPEFLSTRRNIVAPPGGEAVFVCRIAQLGDKAVSWVRARDLNILAHAGIVFSADPRVAASVSGGHEAVTHTLRLSKLRAADAGRYECQLNTEPKLSQIYNLTVRDSTWRSIDVVALGSDAVHAPWGGAATLGCSAQLQPADLPGAPALKVAWYRGDVPLPLSGRGVSLDTERAAGRVTSRLTLGALVPEDAGRYSCRVSLPPDPDWEGGGELEGEVAIVLRVTEEGKGWLTLGALSDDAEWYSCRVSLPPDPDWEGGGEVAIVLRVTEEGKGWLTLGALSDDAEWYSCRVSLPPDPDWEGGGEVAIVLRVTEEGKGWLTLGALSDDAEWYSCRVSLPPDPDWEGGGEVSIVLRVTEEGKGWLTLGALSDDAEWYSCRVSLPPDPDWEGGGELEGEVAIVLRVTEEGKGWLTLGALSDDAESAEWYSCRVSLPSDPDWEGGGEVTIVLRVTEEGVGEMEAMQRDQSPLGGAATKASAALLPLLLAVAAL